LAFTKKGPPARAAFFNACLEFPGKVQRNFLTLAGFFISIEETPHQPIILGPGGFFGI